MPLHHLDLLRALLINNHCHPLEQVDIGSLPCAQKYPGGLGAYSPDRKPRYADNRFEAGHTCPRGGRGSMSFPHTGVLELCSRMQCGHTVQHEAQGMESAPQRCERLCENILSTCRELSGKSALHFSALTLKLKQRSMYKELMAFGPVILLQDSSPRMWTKT